MGLDETPIIIVGAARSGTNVLRDVLTSLPGLVTWPCDEINPVWMYGNTLHDHDGLRPEHADERVRSYIRGRFARLESSSSNTVVEKTCANTLRLDYVHTILPQARMVWIRRDPLDAISSAMLRWKGSTSATYLIPKLRETPALVAPYYAGRTVLRRLARALRSDDRLAMWGPRYPGWQSDRDLPARHLATRQWVWCTVGAETFFAQNRPAAVVDYEEFVRRPAASLTSLQAALGLEARAADLETARQMVHADSVGGWRSRLSDDQADEIRRQLQTDRSVAGRWFAGVAS